MTVTEEISVLSARARVYERILWNAHFYIDQLEPTSQMIVLKRVTSELRSIIERIEREQKKVKEQ